MNKINLLNEILKSSYPGEVIELTAENIENYNLNLDEDFTGISTTHRTKEFLKWRFLKSPFIKYSLYGLINDGSVIAYIALREEEILNPFSYKVNKVLIYLARLMQLNHCCTKH